MKYGNISNNGKFKQTKSVINNIKSNITLKKIINFMNKKKSLDIMKYNKKLQKKLNLSINSYIEYSHLYSSIEIELKFSYNIYGKFINILYEEKECYHIYFDNSIEEIKRNYVEYNNKVRIIKLE